MATKSSKIKTNNRKNDTMCKKTDSESQRRKTQEVATVTAKRRQQTFY